MGIIETGGGQENLSEKGTKQNMRCEQNLAKQGLGEACSRQNTCKGHEVEMAMK